MPRILLALGLSMLFLKLVIAYTTFGTNDMTTWLRFLEGLRDHGGLALYQRERGAIDGFFHPPFKIHGVSA